MTLILKSIGLVHVSTFKFDVLFIKYESDTEL